MRVLTEAPPEQLAEVSGRCDHCTCAPPRSNSIAGTARGLSAVELGPLQRELYDLLRSEAARVA